MANDSTPDPRIALVTGANKGIGYEIAAQLAGLGFTIVLGARDEGRRDEAAKRLRDTGAEVYPVELDVTKPATIAAAAEYVENELGKLDVLVNNAGIAGDIFKQAPSTADINLVREVFEINYFGVVMVTNAMVPLLRRSPEPRIVNVSSGIGSLTQMADPNSYMVNLPPSAAYSPSKTALNAVTIQYAKELRKDNFKVNAIDPGGCDTDFTRGLFKVERTAAQGAAVAVKLATVGPDGPTGGYFNEAGVVAW
jgi:NAD(P)-dependent dehydrogenase (short-subunit alcohol dehydrogenase family)